MKGLLIAGAVFGVIVLVAVMIAMWGIGVYNGMVTKSEAAEAAWSQVVTQYQRRFDLIPNLVEVVKGYAAHEKGTLEAVTNARASVGQMKITPEVLNDPKAFQMFQKVQGELSSVLSRLMVITENYPNLKANENFKDLQTQLEGTENRITVARTRFNEVVQDYNTTIKRFPATALARMFNFKEKQYFQAEEGAEKAPKVKF